MLRHRFRYALTVLAAGAVDTGEELGDGRRGTMKREHQPAEGCRMGRFHVADTAVNHLSKPYNYIYIYSKGISGQYPLSIPGMQPLTCKALQIPIIPKHWLVYAGSNLYIYMRIYIYIYIRIYINYIYMLIYIYTYIYVYIRIYIYK